MKRTNEQRISFYQRNSRQLYSLSLSQWTRIGCPLQIIINGELYQINIYPSD